MLPELQQLLPSGRLLYQFRPGHPLSRRSSPSRSPRPPPTR